MKRRAGWVMTAVAAICLTAGVGFVQAAETDESQVADTDGAQADGAQAAETDASQAADTDTSDRNVTGEVGLRTPLLSDRHPSVPETTETEPGAWPIA